MKQRILILLLTAACVGTCTAKQTKPDLRRIVGIAGEIGVATIEGDVISMFSERNIRIESPTGTWRLQEKRSDAVSVRIAGTEWKPEDKSLSLSDAHDAQMCDPLNQIDISSTQSQLPLLLPKGSRIKIVRGFRGFTIVVYSTSAGAVQYDINTAILRRTIKGNYVLVKTDTATENGTMCGIQVLDDSHYVLFTDEPSGSSDFLALYVYAIVR